MLKEDRDMTETIAALERLRKPTLVSFGDQTFAHAGIRLRTEARLSRFFSDIKLFTPQDLPHELLQFCEAHSHLPGFGYYLWKPYFVQRIANDPAYASATVFWIDSGCWINRFGLPNYLSYVESLTDEKPFVVFERGDYQERQCVKRDVFYHLDAERFLHTAPLMAGVFGFKVNELSRSIISRWYTESSQNVHLIDNAPSRSGEEYPGFESNRNDQGVFSLLLKKSGCYTAFPGQHILPELHSSYLEMKEFPIIAMRDKLVA